MLLNTFAIGFTFIPFHVLRIEKRAAEFSALTLVRSVLTVVLRLVLVVGYRTLGVHGRRHRRPGRHRRADGGDAALVRAADPSDVLARRARESLAFGLPRVPHAAAQQVMAVGDRSS